jgi:6-bladed beta-propeller
MIVLLVAMGARYADGATEINLPAAPSAQRTIELTEVWRFGADELDDVLLGLIVDADLGADGKVHLLDSQLSQILVFSREGDFLNLLSRKGEGPGELNQPHSLIVFPDDRVGAIQWYPGKLTVINPDNTPGGVIRFGGQPAGGGFDVLGNLRRLGDYLLGIHGHNTIDMAKGTTLETTFLALTNLEGENEVVIVEHVLDYDLRHRVFDEKARFSELAVWAGNADGMVYTTPVRDEYVINVRGRDGAVVRTMRREFQSRHRSKAEKMKFTEGTVRGLNGEEQTVENRALDTDPAIIGLDVAGDGRLFVRTCYDDSAQLEKGIAGRYDIISRDGQYIERLTMTAPDFDGARDRLVFLDGDDFIVIRNFEGAQTAMNSNSSHGNQPGKGTGADTAEPLEVVYYRMDH